MSVCLTGMFRKIGKGELGEPGLDRDGLGKGEWSFGGTRGLMEG